MMLQSIIGELKLSKKRFMWLTIIVVGIWLLGECIGAGAMSLANDIDTYFSVGSILALITTGLVLLINGFWNGTIRYNMAVSMGCTRRTYLISSFVVSLLEAAVALILTFLVGQISELIYHLVFAQLPPDGEFYGILTLTFLLQHSWKFLLGSVGVVLLGYCSGALFQRFGKIVLIVLWALYMFFILFSSNLSHILKTRDTTTLLGKILIPASDIFSSLPVGFLPFLGIVLVAALLIYCTRILLRGAVK